MNMPVHQYKGFVIIQDPYDKIWEVKQQDGKILEGFTTLAAAKAWVRNEFSGPKAV